MISKRRVRGCLRLVGQQEEKGESSTSTTVERKREEKKKSKEKYRKCSIRSEEEEIPLSNHGERDRGKPTLSYREGGGAARSTFSEWG